MKKLTTLLTGFGLLTTLLAEPKAEQQLKKFGEQAKAIKTFSLKTTQQVNYPAREKQRPSSEIQFFVDVENKQLLMKGEKRGKERLLKVNSEGIYEHREGKEAKKMSFPADYVFSKKKWIFYPIGAQGAISQASVGYSALLYSFDINFKKMEKEDENMTWFVLTPKKSVYTEEFGADTIFEIGVDKKSGLVTDFLFGDKRRTLKCSKLELKTGVKFAKGTFAN